MRLWEHTMEELVGGVVPAPDVDTRFVEQPFDLHSLVPLTDRPKFATAMSKGASSMADQVLLVRDGEGWRCIGHWIKDTITLSPEFSGEGLAAELFLRSVEHRDRPITANFTQSGHNLLQRVHSQIVRDAVRCGLNVPEKVLKEYPDLTK